MESEATRAAMAEFWRRTADSKLDELATRKADGDLPPDIEAAIKREIAYALEQERSYR